MQVLVPRFDLAGSLLQSLCLCVDQCVLLDVAGLARAPALRRAEVRCKQLEPAGADTTALAGMWRGDRQQGWQLSLPSGLHVRARLLTDQELRERYWRSLTQVEYVGSGGAEILNFRRLAWPCCWHPDLAGVKNADNPCTSMHINVCASCMYHLRDL